MTEKAALPRPRENRLRLRRDQLKICHRSTVDDHESRPGRSAFVTAAKLLVVIAVPCSRSCARRRPLSLLGPSFFLQCRSKQPTGGALNVPCAPSSTRSLLCTGVVGLRGCRTPEIAGFGDVRRCEHCASARTACRESESRPSDHASPARRQLCGHIGQLASKNPLSADYLYRRTFEASSPGSWQCRGNPQFAVHTIDRRIRLSDRRLRFARAGGRVAREHRDELFALAVTCCDDDFDPARRGVRPSPS